MSNQLIHSTMRGGGVHRPSPEVIALKVKEYRRRKHLPPEQYTIADRRITAYVLAQHFEFTPRQIADLLHCTPRTAISDIRLTSYHVRIYPHLADKVTELYDYIIYNARYIH